MNLAREWGKPSWIALMASLRTTPFIGCPRASTLRPLAPPLFDTDPPVNSLVEIEAKQGLYFPPFNGIAKAFHGASRADAKAVS